MAKYIHKKNIKFKNYVSKADKKRILGVALDTSKTFHRVIVFNFLGELVVKPFSIDTLQRGYDDLKRQIDIAQRRIKAERTYIALETPARYTENLVYHLRKDYKWVVFVPPYEVAQNRKQRRFKGLKSDEIDCGAVADLMLRGEFNIVCDEKSLYLRLRNLVYWREQKLIMRTMIKNQLHHRFEKVYPGMNSDYEETKKLFTKPFESFLHIGLLNAQLTSKEIMGIEDDVLLRQFNYYDHPVGPFQIRLLKKRIGEMLLPEERVTKVEIESLTKDMELLRFYDVIIEKAENEIVQYGSQTSAKYLFNQIAGVSSLSASMYVGLIGGLSKYKTAGHVYSYAGLNPKRRQSGKMDLTSIGISRTGNPLLRCLLFRMASQVILCDSFFKEYYHKLREEKGKTWKESKIIICRKLNNIFFALMRDKTKYHK